MKRLLRTLALTALALLGGDQSHAQTAALWRSYGPFNGFVSSVPRHAAPLGSIVDGDSSYNWLVDPTEHKLVRRKGTAVYDSSLIEAPAWRPWFRDIRPFDTPQQSFPSYVALLTNEKHDKGTVIARDLTAGSNYQLATECRTCYPTTGTDSINYVVTPLSTGTTLTRGIDSTQRSVMVDGARKLHDSGNWLFSPGGDGTPWMWNKKFNRAGGSCTQVNRLRPWGQYPPLGFPDINSGDYDSLRSTTSATWAEGDHFFIAVAFQFEDGSYSSPQIPNFNAPVLYYTPDFGGTGALAGYVIIDDDNDNVDEFFTRVRWRYIPPGPHGTIARILLRTPKFSKSIKAAPGFQDLRVTAIIPNNTQTAYWDPNGDDAALVTNPEIVRFDGIWPKAGRYAFSNDARTVVCGALKPNLGAILIAPNRSRTLVGDVAGAGTEVAYSDVTELSPNAQNFTEAYGFYVTYAGSDSLVLVTRQQSGGMTNTATAFTSTTTLGALVDWINNQDIWNAQLVPGADPSTPLSGTNYLLDTSAIDTNDRQRFNNHNGIQWVRNPAWPAVVYYSTTWQAQYPVDDQSIIFTGASPGHAQNAPLNFYVGNKRSPPSRLIGRCLGGAGVRDRFVICYERGIYVLRNQKGGGTGLDEDYRLTPLNENRGCVAWSSIVAGDGWVGYMTADGYVVTDGETEAVISRDVWDPQSRSGEWATAMTKAVAATASDADTAANFQAEVIGGQLNITYIKNASAVTNDRRLVYDFSSGVAASGLAEVLQDGKPYGWSTPLRNNFSAMVETQIDASGPYRFGGQETNVRGRIDKFDAGNLDGTGSFGASAYFPTDFAETYNLKAAEQLLAVYKNVSTGTSLTFYRDPDRGTGYPNTLATSGTSIFNRSVLDLVLGARTSTATFEVKLFDNGFSSTPPEVWTVALKYRILDSVR